MLTDSPQKSPFDRIEALIHSKPVMVFMKGSPDFPQCGFSAKTIQTLLEAGAPASDIAHCDVLADGEIRTAIKTFSKWPTIPQVFIHGEFIGGCDIVSELYESGELQKRLKKTSS